MFTQKKPYSAVTVTVENLTSESHDEDDFSGIIELVEAIKLQATGPSEAARAIRKKLKYGNVHRQIRALVLLDGLIQNAGPRFQRTFADETLLERLRVCGASDLSPPEVRKKCRELFLSWSQYAGVAGLEKIARLHKELPKKKQVVTQERSKVLKETEANPFQDDEEEEAREAAQAVKAGSSSSRAPVTSSSSSSSFFGSHHTRAADPLSGNRHYSATTGSGKVLGGVLKDAKKKKDKSKGKKQPFNLEMEKEQMKSVIADSSVASTDLMNSLQSVNRELERISENQVATEHFEVCKTLRRRVLRYIHHVEHEQWLGGLLRANDELVHALMSFEQFDRSIDADSDSDDELAEQAHMYRMATMRGKDSQGSPPQTDPDLSSLNLGSGPVKRPSPDPLPSPPPPPRRPIERRVSDSPSEPEDDDNPFGDSNVIETPVVERGQPRW